MPHNTTTIRRAKEQFDRVREHLQSTDGRKSIQAACTDLGIPYAGFMGRIARQQKLDLWAICGRKSAQFSPDDYVPKIAPLPPRNVTVKTGPSPEAVRKKEAEDIEALTRSLEVPPVFVQTIEAPPSSDPFGFPRIVYRMHKNFIGTWTCVKMSFFIRVEADVYFVVGYQYELSEFPGVFRADQHLFDYNTDVNVALTNLRRVLDDKVGKPFQDKTLGVIRYGLEYVPPVDPRQIIAKTKIGAPDGEYLARVSGDLGRLEANGKLYEFAIPENLPAGEMPCKVMCNQVTLFV